MVINTSTNAAVTFLPSSDTIGDSDVHVNVSGLGLVVSLPQIATLPQTLNQVVTVLNVGAGSSFFVQPASTDSVGGLGAGVLTAQVSGIGESAKFQPINGNTWSQISST